MSNQLTAFQQFKLSRREYNFGINTSAMAYKGFYRLKNAHKCRNKGLRCRYRSSLERRFIRFCDENSSVIVWAYEKVGIPYICATDNKRHTYFVDFIVQAKTKNGGVKLLYIEIKHSAETKPPKEPKKHTRSYTRRLWTWHKNQSKWSAAKLLAEKNGIEFHIITEKHLSYIGDK